MDDKTLYMFNFELLTELNKDEIGMLHDIVTKLMKLHGEIIEDSVETLEHRICDVCGKVMLEGFVIEGGFGYWCSDECLRADGTTEEELQTLFDEEELYYTEWN